MIYESYLLSAYLPQMQSERQAENTHILIANSMHTYLVFMYYVMARIIKCVMIWLPINYFFHKSNKQNNTRNGYDIRLK